MTNNNLIKKLIINNPYKEPSAHWKYSRLVKKHIKAEERRPAGYYKATSKNPKYDDPGKFVSLDLVNKIRKKVKKWKENNYPNITDMTRELLMHWYDLDVDRNRFFFCQMEAIETIIWATESDDAADILNNIKGDNSPFRRLCSKMATGTGKTVVMSMLITWQVLNHSMNPLDPRFTNNVLIMVPSKTVNRRLGVLQPENIHNYYDEYAIIPQNYFERINNANIVIRTWQGMLSEEKTYKVEKRGRISDYAFVEKKLGTIDGRIIVINDEAHHAWRLSDIGNSKTKKKEKEMATKWIETLDRINNYNGKNTSILNCYDFSATPFKSTGKNNIPEDMMFNWIISDFSLNDSIESGLVKTPRISVKDDSGKFSADMRSRLYHIYANPEVASNLKTNNIKKELPDLIKMAYFILNQHWLNKKTEWEKISKENNAPSIPPVMITVCNKAITADRIERYLKNEFGILSKNEHFIRIDTKTLKLLETIPNPNKLKNDIEDHDLEIDTEEQIRTVLNSVGKIGMPGEQIWNIVAVQMLSEGWDAHNVTHIMGLRAFSSQLLCEQVVGRGLRRMSYEIDQKTNFLKPEYVDIFGIPFTFLPHEADKEGKPDISIKPIPIFPDPEKNEYELSWPNVIGIRNGITDIIKIDMSKLKQLKIYSTDIITAVGMAAVVENKPVSQMTEIEISDILSNADNRLQRIIFTTAKAIFEELEQEWNVKNMNLLAQLVKIIEIFIESGKIEFADLDESEHLKRKITLLFNLGKVIHYIVDTVKKENVEYSRALLDNSNEIIFTSSIRQRNTVKTVIDGKKTHMNLTPYQYSWEAFTINELDRSSDVLAWIKIDQIGFKIKYYYESKPHLYQPDFIIKLHDGSNIILEIKGKGKNDTQNKAKWKSMEEWINAVNTEERFGKWQFKVLFSRDEIREFLKGLNSKQLNNDIARCPMCKKSSKGENNIERNFGYRNCQGLIKPQSWCRSCRIKSTSISKYKW